MSQPAYTYACMQDAARQLTLYVIAEHVGHDGCADITSGALCAEAHVASPRSMRNYLARLEADGFIRRSSCSIELIGFVYWMKAGCPDISPVEKPQKRKKKIPRTLRWEIFVRDGFRCVNCGSQQKLRVDHKYPETMGGTLDPDNLQTLCDTCNCRKGRYVRDGGSVPS